MIMARNIGSCVKKRKDIDGGIFCLVRLVL